MNIDFNSYSIKELSELNHQLVEHIRLRRQRESQQVMHKFDLGDLVCFENDYGEVIEGRIIRFNQKSVTIEKDCGHSWRVSPQLLEKVIESKNVKEKKIIQDIEVLKEAVAKVTNYPNASRNSPCPCGSGKKYKRCCLQ
jgi:preprotein translocase subunit SecA